MFAKFDFEAKQAIYMAGEESRMLGHSHIDPHMLVAGILKWYGSSNPPPEFSGFTLQSYRDLIVHKKGRGYDPAKPCLSHTPSYINVLKYASDHNDRVTVKALIDAIVACNSTADPYSDVFSKGF